MGQTFSTWRLLAAALCATVSLATHAAESRTSAVADFHSCATKNNEEGLRYLRLAAADNNLGYAYETGSGVAQDYAAARDWYVRAAGQGNGNAQAAPGGLYEHGLGVEKDLGRAAAQDQMAAAQNNADGLYRLAALHEAGQGVLQSATTAAAMYLRSANLDFEAAMRRLATAYQKGELGLKADAVQAQAWREKADRKAASPRFTLS